MIKRIPAKPNAATCILRANSLRDYDWGNPRFVTCHSRASLNFPDVTSTARKANCAEWGNGDIRQHHLWWFRHFPHVAGGSDGISYNWWEYVLDANRIQ